MSRLETLQANWATVGDKQGDINPDDYAWLLGHAAGLQLRIDGLVTEKKHTLRRREIVIKYWSILLTKICHDLENGVLFREDLEPYISEIEKLFKERTSRLSHAKMMEPLGDAPPMSVREEPLSQKDIDDIVKMVPRCRFPPEGWVCTREPGHDPPCTAWLEKQVIVGDRAADGFAKEVVFIDSNPECQCGCSYKSHQGDRGDCTNCLLCPKFRVSP